MPEVYRVGCQNCLWVPEVDGSVAAWVVGDSRICGIVVPAIYDAYRRDGGQLVCLPHPLEASTLKKTLEEDNRSMAAARLSGRLLTVRIKICKYCGTIGEEPRVTDNSYLHGCVTAPLTTLVTFLVTNFVFDFRTGIALGAATLAGLLCPLVAKALYAARWSRMNREMSIEECPVCGADQLCEVPDAIGHSMMCPRCKTMNLVCSLAGVS